MSQGIPLELPRQGASGLSTTVLPVGGVRVNKDTKAAHLGDGVTPGGRPLAFADGSNLNGGVIGAIQTNVTAVQTYLSQTITDLSGVHVTQDTLTQAQAQTTAALQTVHDQVADSTAQVAAAKTRLDAADLTLDSLGDTVSAAQTAISQAQTDILSKASTASVTAVSNALTAANNTLTQGQTTLTNGLATLNGNLSSADTRLTAAVAAANSAVSTLDDNLTAADTRLTAAVAAANSGVSTLNGNLTAADNRLTQGLADLDTAVHGTGGVDDKVADLYAQVSLTNPEAGSVASHVLTVETTVQGKADATRVTALEATVGVDATHGLQSRVGSLETVTSNGTFASASSVSDISAELATAREGEPTLKAAIDTVNQARIDGDATLASRTTVLEAGSTSLPNLLKNSDFSQGLKYWTDLSGGWTATRDQTIGFAVYNSSSGQRLLVSDWIPASAAQGFVLSYDGVGGSAHDGYAYIDYGNSSYATISAGGTAVATDQNWSVRKKGAAVVTPTGTAYIRVVCVKTADSDTFALSRIKLNSGNVATDWTDDQSAADSNARIASVETVTSNGTFASAESVTSLVAELSTARNGQPNLKAEIDTVNQARVDGDSALSTRTTNLEATVVSRPNIVPNGGLENDLNGWTAPGFLLANTSWGKFAYIGAFSGQIVASSAPFSVYPGVSYVVTGDSHLYATPGTAGVYFDLYFYDGSGAALYDGPQNILGPHNFSENDSNRKASAIQVTAPTGAATAVARFVVDGTNIQGAGFRQVKVELGELPATPYSSEGTVIQTHARILTEEQTRSDADGALSSRTTALEATVNTPTTGLYSRVGSVEQATTDLATNKADATRVTTLEARSTSYPNLIKNSDFSQGNKYWTQDEGGWGFGRDNSIGYYAGTSASGYRHLRSDFIVVNPGATYCLGYDGDGGTLPGGGVYCDFFDSSHTYISGGPGLTATDRNWGIRKRGTGFGSPSNCAFVQVVVVKDTNSGGISVSRIKLNSGNVAADWTDDQTAADSNARIATVETATTDGTFASASSVTTLSAEINNARNGQPNLKAEIDSVNQARVDGDSAIATRTTSLEATVVSRPNIVPNGGLENDLNGWSAPNFGITNSAWGKYAYTSNFTGQRVAGSAPFSVYPGITYVVTGDSQLFSTGAADVYFDLYFFDGAGNALLDGPQNPIYTSHDFSALDANRKIHAIQVTAPAGAAQAVARFIAEGTGITTASFRQVKAEIGTLPATPYTSEGSAIQTNARILTEEQTRSDADSALSSRTTALEATVNTPTTGLYARVGSVEQATTDLATNKADATRVSVLEAKTTSIPNLIKNSDFSQGSKYWTDLSGGWSFGRDQTVGYVAYNGASGAQLLVSDWVPASPNQNFVLSYDAQGVSQDEAYIDVGNSSYATIYSGGAVFSDNSWTSRKRGTAISAPAGTAFVRVVIRKDPASTGFSISRIKLNAGTAAADWTDDQTAADSNARIATVETATTNGTFASASSVTTLSAEINNARNGQPNLKAEIDSVNQARVDGDSAIATRTTNLEATVVSRPNIVPNGGFENDLSGWSAAGYTLANTSWGKFAYIGAFTGQLVAQSAPFQVYPGVTYVVTGDSHLYATPGTADVYFDLYFYDGSGNGLYDGPQNVLGPHNFSENDTNRKASAIQATAPTGAVTAVARFVVEGTNIQGAGFRQVKVELGELPATPYTSEGSQIQTHARILTEEQTRSDADGALSSRTSALEATVNTPATGLYARVGSVEQATTDLATNKADATRVTTLEARATSYPNLIKNSDFSQGTKYWSQPEGGWGFGRDNGIGYYAGCNASGYRHLRSDLIAVNPSNTYTLSFDGDGGNATAGGVYCDFYDSSVNYITGGPGVLASDRNWAIRKRGTGFTTPSNCAFVQVVAVKDTVSDGFSISRIKLNAGSVAADWTDDQTGADTTARLSTVETVTTNGTFAAATRVTALESTVNASPGGVANLASRMTTVESTTSDLSTNKADSTRVTSLEAELSGARGSYTNVAAKLTALDQARVDGDNALSTRAAVLEAKTVSIPNLIKNSDFSQGGKYWNDYEGASWGFGRDSGIGYYAGTAVAGDHHLGSDLIPVYGSGGYCISYDGDGGPNHNGGVYVDFYDSSQAYIGGGNALVCTDQDWLTRKRGTSFTTPSNCAFVRVVLYKPSGSAYVSITRVKLNTGSYAADWTDDQTGADTNARLGTVETATTDGTFASASSVTTLQAEVNQARGGQANLSAKINSVDQARADGDSANASRATTLESRIWGNNNLVPYAPESSAGFAKWSPNVSGSYAYGDPNYGDLFFSGGHTSIFGSNSPSFPVTGGQTYTISANIGDSGNGASCYIDLQYTDSNGNNCGDGGQNSTHYDLHFAGSGPNYIYTEAAPNAAVTAYARFLLNAAPSGTTQGWMQRVKVEVGSTATPYSTERAVASVGARIATEESTRSTADAALASRASVLEATVNASPGGVVNLAARMGTVETTTTDLATNKADASRVTSLEAEVHNARGGQANLSANLATIEQAQADGDSANASRSTSLESKIWGNINLVPYAPETSDGFNQWSFSATGAVPYHDPNYGDLVSVGARSVTFVAQSPKFTVGGGQTYTVSGNLNDPGNGVTSYLDLYYYDAGGNPFYDGGQNTGHYELHYAAAGPNYIHTETAPSGAVTAVVRYVLEPGSGASYANFQKIKVETGSVATPYTTEAAVASVGARIATEETTRSTADTALASRTTALEATVNTPTTGLSARVGSVETATTNLATNKADASRVTVLEAKTSSIPNLIKNSDFSQGGKYWNDYEGASWGFGRDSGIGYYAGTAVAGDHHLGSDLIPVYGSGGYCISYDGDGGPNHNGGVYVDFYDSSQAYIGGGNALVCTDQDWLTRKRGTSFTTPSNCAFVRVVLYKPSGSAYVSITRVKLNTGSYAADWTDDQTGADTNARLGTVETATTDGRFAAASRVTSLEAEVSGARYGQASLSAELSVIDTARVNGDSSLTQQITQLTATSTTSLNRNATFGNASSSTLPTGWHDWSFGTRNTVVTGFESVNGLRYTSTDAEDVGFAQNWSDTYSLNYITPGWYVMEVDAYLESGTWGGAGILVEYRDKNQGYAGVDAGYVFCNADPDIAGVVSSTQLGRRQFSKLVHFTINTAAALQIYAMTNWVGLGPKAAKSIQWHRCAIRPASSAEIQIGRALADHGGSDLTSQITTINQATTDLTNNKAEASTVTSLQAEITTARNGEPNLLAQLVDLNSARVNGDNALSTRSSVLESRVTSVPNLLKNSDFSQGLKFWSGATFGTAHDVQIGYFAYCNTDGDHFLTSDPIPTSPGTSYTLSYDGDGGSGGNGGVYCLFLDSGQNYIGESPVLYATNRDWYTRKRGTVFSVPSGCAYLIVSLYKNSGTDGIYISRIKLNFGSSASDWTDDQTNGDLTSRVATNEGAISSLDGKTTAWWNVTATAPGGSAIVGINADSYGTNVVMDGDKVFIGQNWTFDKATQTMRHSYNGWIQVLGGPFGASGNLVAWHGPSSISVTGMTTTNGVSAKDVSGNEYINGTSGSGRLAITNQQVNVYDSSNTLRVQLGLW